MRSPAESLACRTLWRRVLLGVVTDLCGAGVNRAGLREAERWVGNWISRDFREVCELAGVDPGPYPCGAERAPAPVSQGAPGGDSSSPSRNAGAARCRMIREP